ncbi:MULTISPECIES: hypothetical protein [unclassified Clostridium]|uniref:hypothetical protein n=1 Tax=unclassified Clostridium TaxID=2614128 RepID=UPI000297A280|nr:MULTISPECIES: hypothetical protein [unclassified Clostridium]EKQ55108.1 MAG: hypothetical protein A370_02882 [Clostridium sp. Maddingley MBC34-26]
MSKVDLLNILNKYSKDENYEFNGYLMYKDKEIAEIKDTNLIRSMDDDLLPIIMINKKIGAFEAWLQTRVIDTHRTNSRQVRRRLSVRSEVPKEIVIRARAVSITDNYWLKWENENITYNEVRNRLSDGLNTVALYGNVIENDFSNDDITPELTNIGSFEKCWRLINGHWYMIKKGSYKENFAEVLVSNIALDFGFKAVKYEAIDEGTLVRCRDFTNSGEVDFEPMFSFVKDYWGIDDSIKIIEELGYIKDFLDITFMDALCYNIDRHTFNFGILRKDGDLLGLAPNFDNNLAFSGVLNDRALEKSWYSTAFTKNTYKPILEEYKYDIPQINFNKIESIIDNTLRGFPTLEKETGFKDIVFRIIKNNYDELIGIKNN